MAESWTQEVQNPKIIHKITYSLASPYLSDSFDKRADRHKYNAGACHSYISISLLKAYFRKGSLLVGVQLPEMRIRDFETFKKGGLFTPILDQLDITKFQVIRVS